MPSVVAGLVKNAPGEVVEGSLWACGASWGPWEVACDRRGPQARQGPSGGFVGLSWSIWLRGIHQGGDQERPARPRGFLVLLLRTTQRLRPRYLGAEIFPCTDCGY